MDSRLRIVVLYGFLVFVRDGNCCPDGWTSVDSLCLTFQSVPQNWKTAGSTCVTQGGHLAVINDATENSALITFRLSQPQQGGPVWLGMYKDDDNWQWRDGKSIAWSDWTGGIEPAGNGVAACGTMEQSGLSTFWSSKPCAIPFAFICQYTDQSTEVTTDTTTNKSLNWKVVKRDGQYSGRGILLTGTSLSRIDCVTQCQTTASCDAAGYHATEKNCQLITGGISANQITASPGWELWEKKDKSRIDKT